MPTAKNVEAGRLVSVRDWCAECTCLEAHEPIEPDFIKVEGNNPDTMSTRLLVTSKKPDSTKPIAEEFEVPGIHREDDVELAFNACEGLAFDDGDLVCGGLAILRERGRHGREEVLTR